MDHQNQNQQSSLNLAEALPHLVTKEELASFLRIEPRSIDQRIERIKKRQSSASALPPLRNFPGSDRTCFQYDEVLEWYSKESLRKQKLVPAADESNIKQRRGRPSIKSIVEMGR